jgi:probable phosphoglycerate mutase
LWRHGQTAFNAERRFQGQTDIPLNAIGLEQAAIAARYLAALCPAAIFSSDLGRATQTASALARLTGLSVKLDEDLRERHGGEWEGLTDAEIRERFPDAYASWVPPGGESATQVADRASAALERIADSMSGGTLAVVVGHGANLGMGLARLLGIPDGVRVLGPFGNCRWSVAGRRLGRWRLMEHNVGSLPDPVPEPEGDRADDGPVEAELGAGSG